MGDRQLLISEAFDRYCRDFIVFKGQSQKTEESYVAARDQMLKRFGNVDIHTITFDDVRDWKLWLDRGRSPNTVRNYIICLRVVLKYLRASGYAVLAPENIPVPKRQTKEAEYLTEQEVKAFIRVVARPAAGYSTKNRLRNVALVKFLYATGLRNSELCSLNRNSIKDYTFTVVGKGGKPRIGFVSKSAMQAVNAYLAVRTDACPALFISHQTGARITPDTIRKIFANTCEKSGMKNIHPHTMRHSYATTLLKRRVDIRYVKEFMGHASLETTAHYTHLVNEDLKAIYNKAHAKY